MLERTVSASVTIETMPQSPKNFPSRYDQRRERTVQKRTLRCWRSPLTESKPKSATKSGPIHTSTFKKVTIRINEPTREWTVKSDEGDLLRDSKDVELRGNVVVVSSDGLRLETTRLN